MAATNCRAAICHIPRLFVSLYNAFHAVDYHDHDVSTMIKEIAVFIRLKESELLKALLNKFYLSISQSKREAPNVSRPPSNHSPVVTEQTTSEDAVWHRSKSARYQQNQSARG